MFRIGKKFLFSASHVLEDMVEGHPCGRLHGHNYVVEITLVAYSVQEPQGWVKDFRDLDFVKQEIDKNWDHRHINNVLSENPTSENIAYWFWLWVDSQLGSPSLLNDGYAVEKVRVSETEKTFAEYIGE